MKAIISIVYSEEESYMIKEAAGYNKGKGEEKI